MNSMTGYGKGVAESAGRKVGVEIKSVNHRFLDMNIKLPRTLGFAEDIIRSEVKGAVTRGHLDIYVNYERESGGKISMDEQLARDYCTMAAKAAMKFSITNDLSVSALFRMPEVVVVKEEDEDEEAVGKLVEQAVREALNGLSVMRAKEGEMLMRDFSEKLANISAFVDEVEKLAPVTVEEHKNRMRERITEMLGDVAFDEARLMNEAAFFADKVAVDEEIARLRSHIAHFKDICAAGGALGKKLDFIVQEMNRETNTIGSKCSDSKIAQCVISAKCEIEKVREQVQNVE
ncbi:MAG TPA: YicC family protein [Firmicutes bacterium]|nr:YicC family protein [Bacillota bacterium]